MKKYGKVKWIKGSEPKIGVAVTLPGYTDCYPATIVDVLSPKKIVVRQDRALKDPSWKPEVSIGGFSAHVSNNYDQKWLYEQNLDAEPQVYTLRKNGKWVKQGQPMKGERAVLGYRKYFYDYNF